MSDIIDKELISHANNDKILIHLVKNLVINRFLIKKIYHILWHIFHSFSILYPEYPSEEQKNQIKTFILQIKDNLNLICSSCNNNKDQYLQNIDLDNAVSSRDNLIDFFCNYHIEINTKYRPQINSYDYSIYNKEYILNKYTKNDFITLIENKYNINLFNLFQSNNLDIFFNKFNDVKKQIYNEQYNFTFDFYGLL